MRKIGCCDSGLGGLLVASALNDAFPQLDIVYIADQANAPYGNKSIEQLLSYIRSFLRKFESMDIDEVVVACNTLCAHVVEQVRCEFPQLTIHSIIAPTVAQLKNTSFQKIHVLATQNTCQSHAYFKALQKMGFQGEIIEKACPNLVPIIEGGCDCDALEKETKQIVHELKESDAWILGCTHYPLIRPYLSRYSHGQIFDSNAAIVDLFKGKEMNGEGNVLVYTTKDPKEMARSMKQLLNRTYPIEKISLE